jgi:dTDP-4-dehydrorhamnose 3,5-epimerase-like enzyme
MTTESASVRPVDPESIHLHEVHALPRVIHYDSRGFLVETLRRDDVTVRGSEFAMSYASVTLPGEYRDRDRWHVHRIQTDRFVVVLGEMILALYDSRSASPTRGHVEVVRMEGAPYDRPASGAKKETMTSLVPIPPGVYHCIGNFSARPFVLLNFPTELYSSDDEGRVGFRDVPIDSLQGPFEWDRVRTEHAAP